MKEKFLPIIEVKQLHKRFLTGQTVFDNYVVQALTDISFSLNKGDSLGVIGENGSGKTTLLKILSGILLPSEGEVRLKGRVLSVLDIGSGFHPDLTGRQNVFLTASILGENKKKTQQKLSKILEFSGIGDFIDSPVKYYSSGMYLRLAFSLVVNLDADILVLDEVMSVGDNEFQIKSMDAIQKLKHNGKTVVFASHSLDSVSKVCSHCVLLEKGELKAFGKVSDVIVEYMSESVQKYLAGQNTEASWEEVSEGESVTIKRTANTESGHHTALGKTKVTWLEKKCPGNEDIKLLSLRIFNDTKTAFFKSEDNLTIEALYKKLTDIPTMFCYMFSYNLTVPVFIANPFLKNGTKYTLDKEPGKYKLTCRIPSFLFNNGVFSVDAFVLKENDEELLHVRNALTFTVHYDEAYLGLLNYNGKFPGGLMPALEWESSKI